MEPCIRVDYVIVANNLDRSNAKDISNTEWSLSIFLSWSDIVHQDDKNNIQA